jgi:Ser-tRNA(Ala) deacylase AlaX
MTRKVFWQDPYLTKLDTRVAGVAEDKITVEETIFYAFSGGQESDQGTIGGRRVLEARKQEHEIVYTLEAGHGLQAGDAVRMQIDWERRYRLMRLHFAAEIVLELAYRHLKPIEKIGAHIAADKSRIDFEWGRNIATMFPLIGGEANRLIEENHPIVSAYHDEPSEERYWEIQGFSRVPCGGTHIRRTGEIGPVELKRKNIGKGKERIEIYVK